MTAWRLLAAVLLLAAAPSAAQTPLRLVSVQNVAQLNAAIADIRPGDRIEIAPGRYRMKIRLRAASSGTSEAPVVLTARDGPQTVVIDGDGTDIVVKFSAAAHIRLEALDITGGGYHGVFFDNGASYITVDGNRVYDNHARRPMDSTAELKGSGGGGRPNHIAIVNNEIFHSVHPPGGNFQGIDCNLCDDFLIAGNYIHDIRLPTSAPSSRFDRGSCIQMKSNSRNTVIERNRIARCHIGIVFGGEGLASPEHVGGAIRNNLIHDSDETAIVIVNAVGGTVVDNSLFGNQESIRIAADRTYPGTFSDVLVENNILGGPIVAPPGHAVTRRGNRIVPAAQARRDFLDIDIGVPWYQPSRP